MNVIYKDGAVILAIKPAGVLSTDEPGGMPELLRGKGVCVVLFSTPEEICERVSKNDKRPLVNVENPINRIRELLAVRTPYYMRSGIAIAADKNIKNTVEHVDRIYRACLRRHCARG